MSIPILTTRAAREQASFRVLLHAMARPGTVGKIAPHEQGGPFAPAVALLESLLDHEVSFAVLPDQVVAREPLLRYTGSRIFPAEQADFLLCHGPGIVRGLQVARLGDLEYPDRSATVVALVTSVGTTGERLTLSGPGISGEIDVWVDGFTIEHQRLFVKRNAVVPNGVDVVLVAPDGHFTCLPRYTRIKGVTG